MPCVHDEGDLLAPVAKPLFDQGVMFQHGGGTTRGLRRSWVRFSAGIVPLTSRYSRSAHSPAKFKDTVFPKIYRSNFISLLSNIAPDE